MSPEEPRFTSESPAAPALPGEIEVAGKKYPVDQDLMQILSGELPAVVTGCRHGRQVIKQENLFLVSDDDGNLYPGCGCGMGLYAHDTRFLAGWVLRIEDQIPTLLSFSAERNYMAHIEFMNPQLALPSGRIVPQETLYFSVNRAIGDRVRDQIRVVNYNPFPVSLRFSLTFHADYADIFRVRGLKGEQSGIFLQPEIEAMGVTFGYVGQDKVLRQTRVSFGALPRRIAAETQAGGLRATAATAYFSVDLGELGAQSVIEYTVEALVDRERGPVEQAVVPFSGFVQALDDVQRKREATRATLTTSHEIYNVILDRSKRDLASLTTVYETGPYLSAGIPWYTAPFGRDGLVTAMQTLLMGPDLAMGTLRYLARYQATDDDPFRDEEPGKIMHERREGELANVGAIPHTPYYGSVDSTPLFLILLSETFRWTGDLAFVRELWDSVEAALMWLEGYGDLDGDGFVEYQRRSPVGLFSQGWKDSHNAIIRPDATIAEPPIALCEVQGYVYDAKVRIAELCYLLDLRILGDRLVREAQELKAAFNDAFWDEEMGFYVLALDAQKKPVRTRASNPGHCLWSGIVPPERTEIMARALLAEDMFSGWGIRTIAASSPVFNPLSYHNGTVWPHDNAIIAQGLARTGHKAQALSILDALFHAALHFEYYRLPELFCGFTKEGELDRPVPYPVACSPQAWAAGATFMLLQAALGLVPDGPGNAVHIIEPQLPAWLSEVRLESLRIASSSLDLQFLQTNGITTARVLRKEGNVKVLIEG